MTTTKKETSVKTESKKSLVLKSVEKVTQGGKLIFEKEIYEKKKSLEKVKFPFGNKLFYYQAQFIPNWAQLIRKKVVYDFNNNLIRIFGIYQKEIRKDNPNIETLNRLISELLLSPYNFGKGENFKINEKDFKNCSKNFPNFKLYFLSILFENYDNLDDEEKENCEIFFDHVQNWISVNFF